MVYDYKRIHGTKAHRKINLILSVHERYKKSYFFTPPGNASSRRAMEFDTNFMFKYRGVLYEISQSLDCSCRNVYYSLTVHVDGEKKDVRALKKIIKKDH